MTDELVEQVARWMCDQSPYSADDWRDHAEDAMSLLRAINLPAQLEAARTQGWNEAIEAAAEAYETGTGYAPGKLPSQRIRALTKEKDDETR